MNLTELITQWIGEELRNDFLIQELIGYNQALSDLKSKIPDLIEGIERKIKLRLFKIGELNLPYKYTDGKEDYSETLNKMSIDELIEELKQQALDAGWCSGRG